MASMLRLVSAGAALALGASLAHAALFTASLDGLQEVPPNASPGSGTVNAELTGSTLVVDGVFNGLLAAFTASHIHNAPVGSNGGVVRALTITPNGSLDGFYEAANNTFTLTAVEIAALEAGDYYVNVHSVFAPGGEIRGQFRPADAASAVDAPSSLSLGEAWPNPFNPSTTIAFSLAETMPATLRVFDLAGREVATLVDGLQAAGEHEVVFDAAGLPSGLYFATLRAGDEVAVRKLTLLK